MNNRDELADLLAKLKAMLLAHQERGESVRDMRESLQRIEEGILELGTRLREQDEVIRHLKKEGP